MDAAACREASLLLQRLWDSRAVVEALPDPLRPRTRAEGYAVQAELERRGPVFGWKVAASSEAGQRHINVDGPLAGRILEEKTRPDGAAVSIRGNRMRVAEVEFAFRIGRALPPRAEPYSLAETLAAVESLHPAIEIPDSRYADFTAVGAAQLIADSACADQFVLGPSATADWRSLDLAAFAVTADVNGTTHRGVGANVLGDPRVALAWMVNELSSIGVPLASGAVVTTGTCMVPIPVGAGSQVRADFGPLGRVSAAFSD